MSASTLLAEIHEDAAAIWRKIGAAVETLATEAPPVVAELEPVLASVGIPAGLVDELAIAIRAIAAHHAVAPPAPVVEAPPEPAAPVPA